MAWIQFLECVVEGKKQLFRVVLWPPHALLGMSVPTLAHCHTHTQNGNKCQASLCTPHIGSSVVKKWPLWSEDVGNGMGVHCGVVGKWEGSVLSVLLWTQDCPIIRSLFTKSSSIQSWGLSPSSNYLLNSLETILKVHLCVCNSWASAPCSAFLLSCRIKGFVTCLTSVLEWSGGSKERTAFVPSSVSTPQCSLGSLIPPPLCNF